jgi:hypothetical protein
MPNDYDEYNGELDDDWDDYDHCYECGGYGDDYFINDEGELESACPTCLFNPNLLLRRLNLYEKIVSYRSSMCNYVGFVWLRRGY